MRISFYLYCLLIFISVQACSEDKVYLDLPVETPWEAVSGRYVGQALGQQVGNVVVNNYEVFIMRDTTALQNVVYLFGEHLDSSKVIVDTLPQNVLGGNDSLTFQYIHVSRSIEISKHGVNVFEFDGGQR